MVCRVVAWETSFEKKTPNGGTVQTEILVWLTDGHQKVDGYRKPFEKVIVFTAAGLGATFSGLGTSTNNRDIYFERKLYEHEHE